VGTRVLVVVSYGRTLGSSYRNADVCAILTSWKRE
jgi:hypothetical protein